MTRRATSQDGWGRYTVGVVRAIQKRGVVSRLISAESEIDPSLERIDHAAILPPLFERRFEMPRSLLSTTRLQPFLAECDLVHCLVELYLPLVAWSLPGDVPLVMTAHGTWAVRPLQSMIRRWFFKRALRRVDLLVCQSEYTRTRMARWTKLPRNVVLSGGVDPAEFDVGDPAVLPDWAKRGTLVLSVGSHKDRKGHTVTLQAMAKAAAIFPETQFVFIGEGISSRSGAALQAEAEKLGLAHQFHLLAGVPAGELAAWYRRATVYMLLPVNQDGSFEGFGLTYLEASAAGVPSIATRDCGAEEAVLDGETGILVPQSDPEAAAAALMELLRDADLRAQMGQMGRRHALRHTWDGFAGRLHTNYLALIEGQRSEVGM